MKKSICIGIMSLLVCSVFAETDYVAMEALKKLRNGATEKNYRIEDLYVEDDAIVNDDLVVVDDASVGGDLSVTGGLSVTGTFSPAGVVTGGTYRGITIDGAKLTNGVNATGATITSGTFTNSVINHPTVNNPTLNGGTINSLFCDLTLTASSMTSTSGVISAQAVDVNGTDLAATKTFMCWFEDIGQSGTAVTNVFSSFLLTKGDVRRYFYTMDSDTNQVIDSYLISTDSAGDFLMRVYVPGATTNKFCTYSSNGEYNSTNLVFID